LLGFLCLNTEKSNVQMDKASPARIVSAAGYVFSLLCSVVSSRAGTAKPTQAATAPADTPAVQDEEKGEEEEKKKRKARMGRSYHFCASLLLAQSLLACVRCWPCGLGGLLIGVLAGLELMPTTPTTTKLSLLPLFAALRRRYIVATRIG
jgi:hypothetical protein